MVKYALPTVFDFEPPDLTKLILIDSDDRIIIAVSEDARIPIS